MHVQQSIWTPGDEWSLPEADADASAQWVLVFGSPRAMGEGALFSQLRRRYPLAAITGCSTAGEIHGLSVREDSLSVSAVRFEHARVDWARVEVGDIGNSAAAARCLVQALVAPGLRHVIVLCDGLSINGSEVARALQASLPADVTASGGLAADGERFARTLVACNAPAEPGVMLGIGLYGSGLHVGVGSLGGWDVFGPARRVTRSRGNVLFELDGRRALDLYKAYLGEHAAQLPVSGLHFPLQLDDDRGGPGVVRTVLGVDDTAGSMTFAGDLPEGRHVRLMCTNVERLIDGACGAAQAGRGGLGALEAQLALLISCVGRKLVLRQRTEEEIEGVRGVLGGQAALTGFYSYGEIGPHGDRAECELHNQTMTITALAEA